MSAPTIRSQVMRNMRGQQSRQSLQSRLKKGDFPEDLGLMPETYIRPLSKDMPAWTNFRRRLRAEWQLRISKYKDVARFLYLNYQTTKKDPITGKRITTPWLLNERYFAARQLHYQFYNALAAGDESTISKIACTGLHRHAEMILEQRRLLHKLPEIWQVNYIGWSPSTLKQGFQWWLMQAYCPPSLKTVRIVSDKTSPLPIGKDINIRQVVAEIKSFQTLDKRNSNILKTLNKTEFVVIQKLTGNGEEDDWKIWGTVDRMSKEKLDEMLDSNVASGNTLMDTFKSKLVDSANRTSTM